MNPVFLVLVAGPGIEPGSGGYEPPEVPLLYPAIFEFKKFKLQTVYLQVPLLLPTEAVHFVDISFQVFIKYLAKSCEMLSAFLTPLCN